MRLKRGGKKKKGRHAGGELSIDNEKR